MSVQLSQLPCYVLIGLLWTVFCQAQRAVTDNICIDDRDCTNNGDICLQGTCTPQSALHCPDIVVQTAGEEALVSHLRPVTIEPPGSTCGQNGNNNVIGISVQSSNPSNIYYNYLDFPNIDAPNNNPEYYYSPMFGSGNSPSEELPRPPINEEDFVSQICGVEETVCTERHPRDQRLLIHVVDRQTIGGPQCATETTTRTPTETTHIIPTETTTRTPTETTHIIPTETTTSTPTETTTSTPTETTTNTPTETTTSTQIETTPSTHTETTTSTHTETILSTQIETTPSSHTETTTRIPTETTPSTPTETTPSAHTETTPSAHTETTPSTQIETPPSTHTETTTSTNTETTPSTHTETTTSTHTETILSTQIETTPSTHTETTTRIPTETTPSTPTETIPSAHTETTPSTQIETTPSTHTETTTSTNTETTPSTHTETTTSTHTETTTSTHTETTPSTPTETTPSTPTQSPPGISSTRRRRRQAGDETVVQSCTMKIGENLLGPTGNATLAMRFLLKRTAWVVKILMYQHLPGLNILLNIKYCKQIQTC